MGKLGPRAARIAEREARAAAEQACEEYVRGRLKPQLVANAKAAISGFSKQRGRLTNGVPNT